MKGSMKRDIISTNCRRIDWYYRFFHCVHRERTYEWGVYIQIWSGLTTFFFLGRSGNQIDKLLLSFFLRLCE